jgi:hypothetical protein
MGKFLAVLITICAIGGGALMYYLQVYGFYEATPVELTGTVAFLPLGTDQVEKVTVRNLQTLDAESSPIRFRACFEVDQSAAMLTETYQVFPKPEPLVAPGWFSCFDAVEIGEAIEAGTALSFMGTPNISYGVDRVIAVMPDGRGFAWHQINKCGEKHFEGKPVPENCPPAPKR